MPELAPITCRLARCRLVRSRLGWSWPDKPNSRRIGNLAAVVLVALALSGCASIQLVQDPTVARVRVGVDDAEPVPASRTAPYVVGYALLSMRAYDDALYGVGPRDKNGKAIPPYAGDTEFQRLAGPWRKPWILADALINQCDGDPGARRDFGYGGTKGSCSQSDSPKGRILDGLGVQVWTHGAPSGSFCREIVLAFRGTDRKQTDDWLSNFRPLTRVLPLYDQYEQVQDHIGLIVERLSRLPCFRAGRSEIVAVGHSLGGGLAQQAAYKDGRIKRVFGFDPSFITGYYDLAPEDTAKTSRGLKIERIYEHGEILAYPRLLMRNIYPPSPCDPQIRHIRFNLIHGSSIVAQHSLEALTRELLKLAEGKAGPPDNDGFLPASNLADRRSGKCLPTDAVASLR